MHTAPANDNRPPSYDRQLNAHVGLVRRLSRLMYRYGDPEDMEQEIMLMAVQKARFYSAEYKFATWVHLMASNVAREQRVLHQTKKRTAKVVPVDAIALSTPPTQQDYAELSEVLRRLSGTRDSEALLRIAMGDELADVGADFGVSRERVRQLVARERARLREAA